MGQIYDDKAGIDCAAILCRGQVYFTMRMYTEYVLCRASRASRASRNLTRPAGNYANKLYPA